MKRPTTVTIAGWKWGVNWVGDEAWLADPDLNDGNSGETWGHNLTIHVRQSPGQTEATMREVFFHELMHACLQTTGHTHIPRFLKRRDVEEVIVGGLSPALLAVLHNNPAVRKYLLDLV